MDEEGSVQMRVHLFREVKRAGTSLRGVPEVPDCTSCPWEELALCYDHEFWSKLFAFPLDESDVGGARQLGSGVEDAS